MRPFDTNLCSSSMSSEKTDPRFKLVTRIKLSVERAPAEGGSAKRLNFRLAAQIWSKRCINWSDIFQLKRYISIRYRRILFSGIVLKPYEIRGFRSACAAWYVFDKAH